MKVLICLALVGAILAEVCNAQTCTADQIMEYTTQYATCVTNADANCLQDLCTCCTNSLDTGNSDPNYNCCTGLRGLINCASPPENIVCDALTGGSAAITAAFAVNAVLVLLSAAVTQLFL